MADPNGTGETPTTVAALESRIGRQMDTNRVYLNWDSKIPDQLLGWDVQTGRLPVISIAAKTTTGQIIPWAGIAAGTYDSMIALQASAIAALKVPVILAFEHEPELHTSNGSAADFVGAWRHYVTYFRAHGVTNVSFAPIFLAATWGSPTALAQWYPGDGYVDWIGADGYNGDGCPGRGNQWLSFATIFGPLNSFAVAHNKPAVIAEWATNEEPNVPTGKAQWIGAAASTLESWPQVKAALYFDGPGSNKAACQWVMNSSELSAFATMGAASWFNSRPLASISASPTTGGPTRSVTFRPAASASPLRPLGSWSLDFGDRSTPAHGSGPPPSTVSHVYSAAGIYTATLTVIDTSGVDDYTTMPVTCYPLPAVTTGKGYAPSATSLNLAGDVNPNGTDTQYRFQWGTTSFTHQTPPMEAGARASNVYVTASLTNLAPATTYMWRIVASSVAGSVVGPSQRTTTGGAAPSVQSVAESTRSSTSAYLSGVVGPHQLATTWHFEYGLTTSYGSVAPVQPSSAGSGTSPMLVSQALAGLTAKAKYHFALVAANQLGTTVSVDHTFTAP